MEQLSKVAGIYLLIVALLAGLQFIFQPTYNEIAGFSDGQIWGFLDWFLAVGVIISVFVLGRSFLQDSTAGSNLTITSVLLFVSVGVGLAFFTIGQQHLPEPVTRRTSRFGSSSMRLSCRPS